MSGADTLRAIRAMSPRRRWWSHRVAERCRRRRRRPATGPSTSFQSPSTSRTSITYCARPTNRPSDGGRRSTWKPPSRPTTPSRTSLGAASESSTCSPWSTRPPAPFRRCSSKGRVARARSSSPGRSTATARGRSGPFAIVDCARAPGHPPRERALRPRARRLHGRARPQARAFETANQGTLFLDEIGEMSPATQVKVLRALQSGEFRRIGSNRHIKADLRVIAATNKDLREEVQRGSLPRGPLLPHRGHRDPHAAAPRADGGRPGPGRALPSGERLRRPGAPPRHSRGHGCLTRYRLARQHPGAAERHRAAVGPGGQPGAHGRRAASGDREVGAGAGRGRRAGPAGGWASGRRGPDLTLDEVERHHILRTLERHRWNKKRVAGILGIDTKTLYNKLRRYGVPIGTRGDSDAPPPPPRLDRAEANMSHDAASPAQSAGAAERERILVCDDDPRMRTRSSRRWRRKDRRGFGRPRGRRHPARHAHQLPRADPGSEAPGAGRLDAISW